MKEMHWWNLKIIHRTISWEQGWALSPLTFWHKSCHQWCIWNWRMMLVVLDSSLKHPCVGTLRSSQLRGTCHRHHHCVLSHTSLSLPIHTLSLSTSWTSSSPIQQSITLMVCDVLMSFWCGNSTANKARFPRLGRWDNLGYMEFWTCSQPDMCTTFPTPPHHYCGKESDHVAIHTRCLGWK